MKTKEGMTDPFGWCAKLCAAFASLHRDARVLHLDIKGNNVLADVSKRKVYIIDLGLSVPLSAPVNPYVGKSKLRYWQPPELATLDLASSTAEVYSIAFLLCDVLVPKERGYHKERLVPGAIASRYGNQVVEDTVLRCFSEVPEARPTLDELSALFVKFRN
mmetsp:Transcript_14153/g.30251  ORF Transcript_14153/g.30251 Transcript_14153/m.30251 type:complete len:161 (-) Transcript_14153:49-531(-)